MRNSRTDLLSRPLFIFAISLLLLNDFYLKNEFSNVFTGKLSDIAGLFMFPYFISSFKIKWTKSIYLGTTLLFIFWKSPFSQELINWFQSIGIGFNRVIDYTDLITLIILPFSFSYFQKQLSTELNTSRYLTVPLGVLCLFSIWATTLPEQRVTLNLDVNEPYDIQLSKIELLNSIPAGHPYSENQARNLADSLFYLHFEMIDGSRIDVTALITITRIDTAKSKVVLDSVLYGVISGGLFTGVDTEDVEHLKSLSSEKFSNHFESTILRSIKKGNLEHVYFDNKVIHDSYQNKSSVNTESQKQLTNHSSQFIDTKYEYSNSIGNNLIIENSLPKGGLKYTAPNGKDYVYAIFWTRITNETTKAVDFTIDFPSDSIELPSSADNYFRVFLPTETITSDMESLFNYGLKDLESLLDKGLYKSPFLQQTINPYDSNTFYVVTLFNRGLEGTIRTGFSLKGEQLLYTINGKEIHSGQLNFSESSLKK